MNPLVSYDDLITDDRVIGTWQIISDDDLGFPKEMKIGRVCRPIYEKYEYITNAEGKVDSNHTIAALSYQSSLDDYQPYYNDMKFVRLDSVNFYYANYLESEAVRDAEAIYASTFKISLSEIAGQTYFDLLHKEDPTSHNAISSYSIPAHFMGKVEISDNKLEIKFLDSDNFSEFIKDKLVRLQHTVIEEEGGEDYPETILTATTEDIRSFLSMYGERDDLFSESIVYQKKN